MPQQIKFTNFIKKKRKRLNKKRKRLNKIKFKNFFQKTETPQKKRKCLKKRGNASTKESLKLFSKNGNASKKNENASKKVETPQLNQVFKNTETPQKFCGNASKKKRKHLN